MGLKQSHKFHTHEYYVGDEGRTEFIVPPLPHGPKAERTRKTIRLLPFSRPVISTESLEGGMALVASIQSPTFFSFLYSTRKD